MNILVFDDNAIHRQAAKLQLVDHHVTIVGTYDEAQGLLVPQTNYEMQERFFAEKYGDNEPYKACDNRDERLAYYNGECHRRATKYPDFDVVLTDLLVPASRQAQGDKGQKFVGQEIPLGTTIALLALTAGVKMVAVVTDKNHHDHPASAAFDCFGYNKGKLEGIRILCTNHCGSIYIDEESGSIVEREFLDSDEGKVKYPYPDKERPWGDRRGLVVGKNWDEILSQLIGESSEE